MNLEVYSPIIRVKRESMISGKGVEEIHFETLLCDGIALLQAFFDDDDIQEMTVCSGNIGFVRTYTKSYKGKD